MRHSTAYKLDCQRQVQHRFDNLHTRDFDCSKNIRTREIIYKIVMVFNFHDQKSRSSSFLPDLEVHEMVIFLVKFIILAINAFARLFLVAIANLLVLSIQALKVPGEAIQAALDQVAEVTKWCFEYFSEFLIEAVKTLISSVFDVLANGVSGSAAFAGSAIGGLVEQTRSSFEELLKDVLPKVMEGFSEMMSTIVSDFFNNFKDALGYVTQNA